MGSIYGAAFASGKDLAGRVFDDVSDIHSSFSVATLLSALSFALDLTEGQPMGHSVRACLIALRIADTLGLSATERADLHLSALLKDSGCSSNAARMFAIFGCDDLAAKGDSKVRDWRQASEAMRFALVHTLPNATPYERLRKLRELTQVPGRIMDVLTEARCTRGAHIAKSLGLPPETAAAIYHLDEHWDGQGAPHHAAGTSIPLLSRILCVAQTLEVFAATFGVRRAFAVAQERSGRWFDPEIVRAATSFSDDTFFWSAIQARPLPMLAESTNELLRDRSTEAGIDSVCRAFAGIVDAKSSFTAAHSSRVARVAVRIARRMGLGKTQRQRLYRAGLLHDLGKLAVPNRILDKPGALTMDERAVIERHTRYTEMILRTIPGFDRLTQIAVAHHERLDGSGYHRGVEATALNLEMRILAVADVYDALTADRPYRPAMRPEQVASILNREAGVILDADCVEALLE